MRGQILSLISGLVRGNNALILKTLSQMGIVPEYVDKFAFQADISTLRHKHLKVSLRKFAMGESIQDFFDIIFRHGIQIPSEFILVGKAWLDPTISLVEQAKPFSRRFIWGKSGLMEFWNKIRGTRETDTTGLPINIQ